jgi:hypothetical protein
MDRVNPSTLYRSMTSAPEKAGSHSVKCCAQKAIIDQEAWDDLLEGFCPLGSESMPTSGAHKKKNQILKQSSHEKRACQG